MTSRWLLLAGPLLAIAPAATAVVCGYDRDPAATLLVPYFKVSRNGSTGGDIPNAGVDTVVSFTNVEAAGVIVHVTVWSKYGRPVLGFNVPLTGYDVASFRMRDVLNGRLVANPPFARPNQSDACGMTAGYSFIRYMRFTNPDPVDRARAVSRYGTPAFSGPYRRRVWDSLDESEDLDSLDHVGVGSDDADNPACGVASDDRYAGDFTGYLTLDVVNYCTNYFPDEAGYYRNDALATAGWREHGYTPNVLVGDVFVVDPTPFVGSVWAETAVALEFDRRLDWATHKTFYGRYEGLEPGPASPIAGVPAEYAFRGDGREPLGTAWGFPFVFDAKAAFSELETWAVVWRSSRWKSSAPAVQGPNDLCDWYVAGSPDGEGPAAPSARAVATVYDLDGGVLSVPSDCPAWPCRSLLLPLATQRFAVSGSLDLNPALFRGGYVTLRFLSSPETERYDQVWVGVQHREIAAPPRGDGHGATLLDPQFLCKPSLFGAAGNVDDRPPSAAVGPVGPSAARP